MQMQEKDIIQNLKDAGCGKETIIEFLAAGKKEKTDSQLKILAEHRSGILERLHDCQKQIDCLDYLVYKIEKQK